MKKMVKSVIVLLLMATTGCHQEEANNIERAIRHRLSRRFDVVSVSAHSFGRSGAPRTMKRSYCYVDVVVEENRKRTKQKFKVFYFSDGQIEHITPVD